MTGAAPWERPWPDAHLERVTRCPACEGTQCELLHRGLIDLAFLAAPGLWTMHRCLDCGTAYLDPRPSQDAIAIAYANYYTHEPQTLAELPMGAGRIGAMRRRLLNGYLNRRFGQRLEPSWPVGWLAMKMFPRRKAEYDRLLRHLPPLPHGGGRVLDVGCGNGLFLARARAMGWVAEGVEPDPAAVALARGAGLPVREGGIGLFDGQAGLFDHITLNHVLEHVPDPEAELAACLRLLRLGGTVHIETPNIGGFGHRRFGSFWRGLEAPRHLQVFSWRGLRVLLRRVGFVGIHPMPFGDPITWMDEQSLSMARRADPSAAIAMGSGWRRRYERVAARLSPARREFLSLVARRPG